MPNRQPITIGDINILWNKTDNLDTISLNEIVELYYLEDHVSTPTHKLGNSIDWVMGIINSREFQDLHTSDSLSDHCTTEWVYSIKDLT